MFARLWETQPVMILLFLWRSWPLSCRPDTGSLAGRTESGPFFPSFWQQYVSMAQPSAAPGCSTRVVPGLLAATDLQATLTLKPHQSSTKSAAPVGRGLFLRHESMTPDHSRSSPQPPPPPPVQTVNRTQVLVWLDPKTKTVNLCLPPTRHPNTVSDVCSFQSGSYESFL